jgi:hypothetical protein
LERRGGHVVARIEARLGETQAPGPALNELVLGS